jgi:hypothetical protein
MKVSEDFGYLLWADWLNQVVVGPGVDCALPICHITAARCHNHDYCAQFVAAGSNAAANREAVGAGHKQVAEDGGGAVFENQRQS